MHPLAQKAPSQPTGACWDGSRVMWTAAVATDSAAFGFQLYTGAWADRVSLSTVPLTRVCWIFVGRVCHFSDHTCLWVSHLSLHFKDYCPADSCEMINWSETAARSQECNRRTVEMCDKHSSVNRVNRGWCSISFCSPVPTRGQSQQLQRCGNCMHDWLSAECVSVFLSFLWTAVNTSAPRAKVRLCYCLNNRV